MNFFVNGGMSLTNCVYVCPRIESVMKMKRFFFVSILVLSGCLAANAQSGNRSNTTNSNAWLMYFGNHKVSEKWGIHAEVQWRRHEFLSENQQLLLRGGVDFYTPAKNRFTLGYAFVRTYPYGEFAVAGDFPENRIWQQFLTSQKIGNVNLSHRYRLEQRFLGNPATGTMANGRYENRFRYMAKLTLPIAKEWEKPMFLAVYDEVMLNFGKEVGYNLFDQNRLYGALGFTLTPHMKLEVGYLYQLVQLRTLDSDSKNRIENNHTLQIGLFSVIPFFKAE
jgi:hypothetical protein